MNVCGLVNKDVSVHLLLLLPFEQSLGSGRFVQAQIVSAKIKD